MPYHVMEHLDATKARVNKGAAAGVTELLARVTGRFYTPADIGEPLIEELVHDALAAFPANAPIRVIDPFCGDGRLISWLIYAANKERTDDRIRLDVHLWDCDRLAVSTAAKNVKAALVDCGMQGTVTKLDGDTFIQAANYHSAFDLVVTNPPWDRLKPDARETSALSRNTAEAHRRWLKSHSKLLASLYPWSVPSRRYAGWGINLARCGVELALTLVRPHGWCALVSPASLFADQVSAPLRQWIFRRFAVRRIAYFSAEARLFDNVDQPAATFTVQAVPPHGAAAVRVYDRSLNFRDFRIDPSLAAVNTGYTLPIHGPMECLDLLERSSRLPKFSSLELDPAARLWAGRELDETRHKYLLRSRGARPFVKGRMVGRFELLEKPDRFVAEAPDISLPGSVSHARLVWRDVSRPTQMRRMYAALIPPRWVTGNSLNVAYFPIECKKLLKVLLAVINSLAFELHIRALSATAHVSLGTVRQAAVPDIHERSFVKRMEPLVQRRLQGEHATEPELEALVARAYGFNQADFDLLLSGFPKLTSDYRALLRDAFARV